MDRLKDLNILFLEDNEEFAQNTIEFLNIYFKKVYHSAYIKEALKLHSENKIDIIISDIKLHDGNGLNFIQTIRERDKETPIIVLSAHKDEDFLFRAIPLNITAYELKPLSYEKFLSLLKKLSLIFKPSIEIFSHKNLLYSFKTKELSIDNSQIDLTKKERLFIELLINNHDEVVTSEMIQRVVYEEKLMSDSALKNLLLRVRKKFTCEVIKTVTGVGFKLA